MMLIIAKICRSNFNRLYDDGNDDDIDKNNDGVGVTVTL
jgi:hypothetical protein